MEIRIAGRAQGKTHQLVKWMLLSEKRFILVHSEREAERLRRKYEMNPYSGKRIITVEQAKQGLFLRGRDDVEIAVDNLDLILMALLGFLPAIATLTDGHYVTAQEWMKS